MSSEYVKANWTKGYDAKGQPIPRSGEDAADRRRARLAEPGRRDQLAVAELQPADRTLLRQRLARLQHLLHLRSRRQPDGLGRLRSRRLVRVDDPGDRLQDRQDQAGATNGKANVRPLGLAQHGRQRALHRRSRRTTSSRSTRRPATRCGSPILNTSSATARSPTRWTDCSMSSSAPATRSGRS